MISYEPGIQKYIIGRLSKQKDAIESRNKEFPILLLTMCRDGNKKNFSEALTNKVFVLYEDIWKNDSTLQSSIASLRYILETMIQTELLCNESGYFEKIYYSILSHKINKSRAYIEKVKSDFDVLKDYENKENSIKSKLKEGMSDDQIKLILDQEDRLYDDMDYELTISLDSVEFNSISIHREILEQKVIPSLENYIEEMENDLNNLTKSLAKDPEFNSKFQTQGQSTKVMKALKDTRNWSQKARDAGLENEYKFVYDYTSSLLHCTSFSILTNTYIQESEVVMIRSLANKYVARIFDGIYRFCNIPKNIKLVKMK